MNCEHCTKAPVGTTDHQCCYLKSLKIKNFKNHVRQEYIFEVIFDMVVSTISVVLDLLTLALYAIKGRWVLAVLTAIPVLLPTTVFTNVYMADLHSKKRKTPTAQDRSKERRKSSAPVDSNFLRLLEERFAYSGKLSIFNCIACWSGSLHSLFHKDRNIRKRGAKLARKSVRRSAKYVFGTLVLRFIAWSWYLKALRFGVKALREPKKFMKLERPEAHWTRELLIRLDFFQATLENAPQCVIQLFMLMTDSSENQTVGMLTLGFSFIDFVRVVTTVFWNINKGPVVAPEGSYGHKCWKYMNITSWVFIYTARCCAVALVLASAQASHIVIAVPVFAGIFHCLIFAKLFSNKRFGQAAEKLVVTIFISIFFLPELDSTDIHVLVQFYYAIILLENTVFTIPFDGLDFKRLCIKREIKSDAVSSTTEDVYGEFLLVQNLTETTSLEPQTTDGKHDCLIEPWVIVFLVPALTILGSVIRLYASQKMSAIKAKLQENILLPRVSMEDRIANIYKKRWTRISPKEMWSLFMKMLKKEEKVNASSGYADDHEGPYLVADPDFRNSFRESQEFIRKSLSVMILKDKAYENHGFIGSEYYLKADHVCKGPGTYPRMKTCEKNLASRENSIFHHDQSETTSDFSENKTPETDETNVFHHEEALDELHIRSDLPKGVHIFEMAYI